MIILLQITCLSVMAIAFIKSYDGNNKLLAWSFAIAATILLAILGA